ncbi:MAG: NfeD family protein [Dehalococcoidia bacterium]|nr:NfeD family protein [Dehalococcoidia bacterium]
MVSLDAWLVFVIVGLLLALTEVIIGVQTGYDLVMIGSAFVVGGLVAIPFHSWVLPLIVTSVICVAYVALGRRYVHRWSAVDETTTNVDSIIGRNGVVLRRITRNADGLVKVGHEEWRARSDEDIEEGAEVLVLGLKGVTLVVNKPREVTER